MKELNSEASHDLDAGWDTLLPDSTSVSVKLTSCSQIAAVEELDAGWEIAEPEAFPRPARQPTSSGSTQPLRGQVSPLKSASEGSATPAGVRALSKKERRELERRQRAHAAKRKSEAKEQRKLQRLSEQKQQPASPTPNLRKPKLAVVAPSALRNKDPDSRQRRQPKSKAQAKLQSRSERMGPATLPQTKLGQANAIARNVSAAIVPNGNQAQAEFAVHSNRLSASRWWAIGIALLLLGVIGAALLR